MSTPLYFNASWYLSQNPDVAAAIEAGAPFNAFEHFTLYGRAENRSASPVFDAQEYLNSNPDVAEAVAQGLITAWDHFELFGGAEGRSPTPLFNEAFYLQQNPDVAAAIEQGIISSAAQHFALFGQSEPRAINPAINLGQYISANPDIGEAASNGLISAFEHLLQYGVTEGRSLGNGVSLSDFSSDPGFSQSLSGGNPLQALIRVESVAPFLPTFERPAGWTPPANTPIPVDFVPPAGSGIQLVVPPEVVVPPDVVLPPVFDPVTPPAPPAPTPGGGSGGGGTTPTFTVTEESGTVTFDGTASGDVTVKLDEDGHVQFVRQSVTAEPEGTPLLLGGLKRIEMPDSSAIAVNGVNLEYPQANLDEDATGGSPRFWVDYGDGVGTANVTIKDALDKAAIGVTGANVTELVIGGNFKGKPTDGWHQLQVWDGLRTGNTQLPNLSKLTLNMESNTDLAAYEPHGILTKPEILDGSGSTGGLKITPAGWPGTLGWTSIKTGSGNDYLDFDANQFKTNVTIESGSGNDQIYIKGIAGDGMINIDGGAGNDIISGGAGDDTITGGAGHDSIILGGVFAAENGGTSFVAASIDAQGAFVMKNKSDFYSDGSKMQTGKSEFDGLIPAADYGSDTVVVDTSVAGHDKIYGFTGGTTTGNAGNADFLKFSNIADNGDLKSAISSIQFAENLTPYHRAFIDKNFYSIKFTFDNSTPENNADDYVLELVDYSGTNAIETAIETILTGINNANDPDITLADLTGTGGYGIVVTDATAIHGFLDGYLLGGGNFLSTSGSSLALALAE